MSLLVIGGTGTLGRQIVKQALDEGYQVRCLVRNLQKSYFLNEWGAELVYGDLSKLETIPQSLIGITAIIDASTSRPNNISSVKKVDWYGKLALIKCAKVANIKHFVFCSIIDIDKYLDIPLIKMKKGIEVQLMKSQIPYTILRLTGFYQGLIGQYAIPILEDQPIWITNEQTPVAYMDTQDIAKFCLRSLIIPETQNTIFQLKGKKNWLSLEIIELCEQLAGQTAKISKIPLNLLQLTKQFLNFFEWGKNISDRLSFIKVLDPNTISTKEIKKSYSIFKIEDRNILSLEDYLEEYFIKILKKLQDINFEDVQKQKNLIL